MKKKGKRLSNIFLLVSLLTGCAFGFLLYPVSTSAAEKKEQVYGLVVGGYPDTKNDCELVYDRLKYNNKTSHIKRYDYDSEKAYSTSAETLDNKIKASMSGASKKDTYVFYYSGHSLASGNKVSDVEGLNLYLATANGKKVFASYSWKRLANQLSKFPGKVVVMLDMCHAELFYTEGVSKLTSGKGKFYCIFGSSVDTQSIQGNYFVPSEKRLVYQKKSYGIFTKFMGEGLGYWKGNQRADSNQNGKVSIRELYNYIYQRVQKIKKTNVLYSFEKPTLRLPNGDMELFSYKLSISKTSVSLKKGKYVTLTALSGGKKADAVWKSSNTKVATVRNGKITGKKAGIATITAKANGKTATCKVKVTNVISYTYRYSYSINDFGKYVMNDPYRQWTVKVTPISSTKIKLLFCQNKKEETYTAVKEAKNRYVYTPKNGIYPGYKQVVIWEKEKKRFIFKGEEAGSSYFFEVK